MTKNSCFAFVWGTTFVVPLVIKTMAWRLRCPTHMLPELYVFNKCSESICLWTKSPLPRHPYPVAVKIMMSSSKGNIFRVTGPLCWEFTGHLWIPLTKASDAELWCFFLSAPWINRWVNIREAGDLRRHRAHYDVNVMYKMQFITCTGSGIDDACHILWRQYEREIIASGYSQRPFVTPKWRWMWRGSKT